MLKQIQINNFQSHKDTTLDLHKGVNVFIGNSDSGKSAIIRACRWVFTNKPLGDFFRSHWGGDTSVDITLDDKTVISREKGKNNQYIVSANNQSPKELKAPGSDVPELVKKYLNMDDINIQYQLDSPFLLSSTAGEVAKYLNQVVNLEKIDTALSRVQSWKKTTNDKIKNKTLDLEQKEKNLIQYDYLKDFEKDLKNLENKQKTFTQLKEKYTSLYSAVKQVESLQEELKNNKKKYPTIKEIDAFIKKSETLEALKESYEDLNDKINKVITLQKNLERISTEKKQKEIQYKKIVPDTCPLCNQRMPGK